MLPTVSSCMDSIVSGKADQCCKFTVTSDLWLKVKCDIVVLSTPNHRMLAVG